MRHEYSLFVKVPWHYSGINQEHNLCFQVHDERVAKLLIDGFELSTIDVEMSRDSVVTHEEIRANEGIYHSAIKPKQAIRRSAEIKPEPHGTEWFDGKCQFCHSKPAVGRVKVSENINSWFCCSDCGLEAIKWGYYAVQEWSDYDNGSY